MEDLESIRKRMKNKKYKKSKSRLNDNNFNSFYKFMIKTMILIILCLGVFTFHRMNPNNKLFDTIFKEEIDFSKTSKYINTKILDILPNFKKNKKSSPVATTIQYEYISKNAYKKNNNMVTSLNNGTVVMLGQQELLGKYMVVKQSNGVKVTYGNMENINTKLYDVVKKNDVLGTYGSDVILIFEYEGKEITYEEALAFE